MSFADKLPNIRYRDEYPSGIWTTGAGAANPTIVSVDIAGVTYRKIQLDTTDILCNKFEVPHDIAYGQPIEFHCHFRPMAAGTGNVVLTLNLEWSKVNTSGQVTINEPVAIPELVATCTIATSNTTYPHYIVSFGTITINEVLGDLLCFRIGKSGTYAGNIILEQIAMHVPIDTPGGSSQRYIK